MSDPAGRPARLVVLPCFAFRFRAPRVPLRHPPQPRMQSVLPRRLRGLSGGRIVIENASARGRFQERNLLG